MTYVIPKKLIENAKFEWEELKGKTLKINVGYDELTGSFAVAGLDAETGKIYLLHTEIKKEKPKAQNIIPPMTHPLSSGWKHNPKIEEIFIDDEHARMTEENFKMLLDYSRSFPSGVYEGKMWKNLHEGTWYLNWWGFSDDPGKCQNYKRKIIMIK